MSLATSTRKEAQRLSDIQHFDDVVTLAHNLDISDIGARSLLSAVSKLSFQLETKWPINASGISITQPCALEPFPSFLSLPCDIDPIDLRFQQGTRYSLRLT